VIDHWLLLAYSLALLLDYSLAQTASVNVAVSPLPPKSGVSTDLSASMYVSITADSSLQQQQQQQTSTMIQTSVSPTSKASTAIG
jgi:hypothetical protein